MNKYQLHLRLLLDDKKSIIVAIISSIALGALLFYFTDYATTAGNFGALYTNIHVAVQIILSLLFGFNVGMMVHKRKYSSRKQGSFMAVGSFLAIMTGGCAACGVTLASALGFASVFAALPFYGLEIKLASLGLLVYSTHILCDDTCKLKN